MPHSASYEAIVLKTYDIGDADRFCILLTREAGRITVCAKGVRKPKSKWSSCLQSFQHIRTQLSEHSSGFYLQSAQCIDTFPAIRHNIAGFSLASRGVALLLHMLHEPECDPAVFDLAREYLHGICTGADSNVLHATFRIMLFHHLGILPSMRSLLQETGIRTISPELGTYFASTLPLCERSVLPLSEHDRKILNSLCERMVGEQVGISSYCFAG